MTTTTKRCPKCDTTKPIEDFAVDKSKSDGRSGQCKACKREYHAGRAEERREYMRAYRKTDKGREQKWASRAMERAREHGAPVIEHVRRLDVFERDGWICQLCGEPVEEPGRERRSATVDHATPLSEGGHHTLDNAVTAHFACNAWIKRSRDLAEHWAHQWERVDGEVIPLGRAIAWTLLTPDSAV